MRLPFLKIQQDAFPRAKMLAGFLRTSRREALGLVLDLWAWGLDLTPEDQPPESIGVFHDKDPGGLLAAALEWRDGPDCLMDAMTRAGFVELVDGGLRVRGLDEYATALELPAKRSDAGKRGATKRWQNDGKPIANAWQTDGKAIANDGQTQTQTQTQIKEAEEEAPQLPVGKVGVSGIQAPPSLIEHAASRAPANAVPLTVEKPATPPDTWQAEDFWRWAQWLRQQGGYVAEKPPPGRKLQDWYRMALMTDGMSVAGLKRAFCAFGRDKHWEAQRFPFGAFISQWASFAQKDSHASAV